MRHVAPTREALDPQTFGRQPLDEWRDYAGLFAGAAWPPIEALNACLPADAAIRFAAQTRELLADGLHYETRIAERGLVATRERNWHGLFNALVWLRHPAIKQALNRRQVADIAHVGARQRTRAQCALTHFDEAGVVVAVCDPSLMPLWDAHDWHGLFWRRRQAWRDGSIEVQVFGHALLEHALSADRLLVGKALVFHATTGDAADVATTCAHAIEEVRLLVDPLELRPLPLSGIPGWHPDADGETFHRNAACYQPRRAGRSYPHPVEVETVGNRRTP